MNTEFELNDPRRSTRRQRSPIILALDVDSVERAWELMQATKEEVGIVKIGLELIFAQLAGQVAQDAKENGFEVFWDGKEDDIPTTIAKATKAVVKKFSPKILNVHGNANIEGIQAAVANRGSSDVYVVTILTSVDTENCENDHGGSRNARVLYHARQAVLGGAQGIVCSAKELRFLKKYPELKNLEKIVPGTRSAGKDAHDQKNVELPATAIIDGAKYVVIGREITDSADPSAEAKRINDDIFTALEKQEQEAAAKK